MCLCCCAHGCTATACCTKALTHTQWLQNCALKALHPSGAAAAALNTCCSMLVAADAPRHRCVSQAASADVGVAMGWVPAVPVALPHGFLLHHGWQ